MPDYNHDQRYELRMLELRRLGQLQPQSMVMERLECSRVSDVDKAHLRLFLEHFPDLEYIVSSASELRRYMTEREVDLPRWLIDIKAVFNGFGAFRVSKFNVSGFTVKRRASARTDRAAQTPYEGLGHAFYDGEEELFLKTRLYEYCAIARAHRSAELLTFNARDVEDRAIYKIDMHDVWHEWRMGGPERIEALPVKVFESYAELLANISRITFKDEVIEARGLPPVRPAALQPDRQPGSQQHGQADRQAGPDAPQRRLP
ncbi:hypothetical protein [Deinococcus sp.]|uniref:hypothetical protein n=1 Tax=Deinococcus sp. TaxID=47478 RepID=UPI0025F6808B|nr:hypothetical protein [Deinococcus sp.]